MNDYFKQLQLQKLLSDLTLQIEWYQSLNSTNLKAADQINSALQTPVVIISNQQTSGYGKRGRQFISKPGGLYLSLLTPIHNLNNDNIGLLTTG
ncbi:biotin--[acetyl-CoA-carboxylase] ligase, partial [Lactobacillus sp. XV13L]|nr:biotin--[acetyl-CoA-carboxylase] ligase [Lactobacillus sp. XV13L]